ncbi:cyclin-dependent kinase 11B [Cimex lectularius]|uniref:cyclin-dependent kinase n=1 Tax=Cimex lectularius TaxID=79782 RepID=A0A8I6TL50_CIMLE|nr:cyclin-dependent kinase 11B [Cimex lectularius]
MEDDDHMEDGELKKSPVLHKEPSLESLSLSDEETVDPLEIKPPQAHAHKRPRKSKHSSSTKRHVSSEHRKKRHHTHSHREDRHHHHRERMSIKDEMRSREEMMRNSRRRGQEMARREERERTRIEELRIVEEQRLRDEKERQKREDTARKNREIERDLRDKLEKRRHLTKERDKENEEIILRRQRLMEAERVKESFKKDIEERRMRREARERSRSRERKLEAEQAEAAAQAAAAQAEMERAGLVVVSDESRSPIIMDTGLEEEDANVPAQVQEPAKDVRQLTPPKSYSGQPRKNGNRDSSDTDTSSTSSITDEDEEDEGTAEDTEDDTSPVVSPKDDTPPLPEVAHDGEEEMELEKDTLPPYLPAIQGCRSVEEFQCLNRIEEGTYGVVYRAIDKRTEQIVALKRLKMEKEKEGFPITSLREINTLLKVQHPNIVTVREIVVGSNMDKIYIVMDYVEHDLKSLMETMKSKKQAFVPGEVKCLMQQLLKAVAHLHDNWILHRDLKASNLLLSHKGILKVGDFGLAREYGSPLKPYTPIVVTRWYRAPELLLGAKEYSTPIDMWSVGCIFSELMTMEPLFPGKSEQDQLNKIFKTLGTPNERIWPGYNKLPAVQKMNFTEFPVSTLRSCFRILPSEHGFNLLNGFLTYNPATRFTAETGLAHEYFRETPLAIDPAMFPTWPAKSEGSKVKKVCSPKPPSGGRDYKQLEDTDEGFRMGGIDERTQLQGGPGFSLKF